MKKLSLTALLCLAVFSLAAGFASDSSAKTKKAGAHASHKSGTHKAHKKAA